MMKRFFKNNSLSIVFWILFLLSLTGQVITGFKEYNKERTEDGQAPIAVSRYFSTGHFIESTFENWESEFLQMALFVWLTIFLYQKGSSESKKMDGTDEVDREPDPNRKAAPWPVKKGGIVLQLYKHSLTIALLLLFIASFLFHFHGSYLDEAEQQLAKGQASLSESEYIQNSRFWFESFQNWQSEFLSVFAIIVLSVFLRQKGSAQSKPVDAAHDETGE